MTEMNSDSFFIHSCIYSTPHTDGCLVLSCLCPVPSPQRVRAKVLSPTKLQVWWKKPNGEFDSYKVTYKTQPGKIYRIHTLSCLLVFDSAANDQKTEPCVQAGSQEAERAFTVLHLSKKRRHLVKRLETWRVRSFCARRRHG